MKLVAFSKTVEFYHYSNGIYLYDDKDNQYSIIKDHRNIIMGVWYWKQNILYVFQGNTNTTLARTAKLLCYPKCERIVFDSEYNMIGRYCDDYA